MREIKDWKWPPLIAGVLLVAIGLAALLWPSGMMHILPLSIGLAILLLGICEALFGFMMRDTLPLGSMRLVQGIANMLVGSVLLFNRSVSIVFLAVVLGLWAVVNGMLRLRMTWERRAAGQTWGGCLADALLKIAVGLVMIFSPFGSMAAWTAAAGVFLVFTGVSLMYTTFFFDNQMKNF